MHNFFIKSEDKVLGEVYISGADFNHLKNVLRMKIGDEFLVSLDGVSHLCVLKEFKDDCAVSTIKVENFQDTALPVKIYLFQGLPKADKLELIIQKAVELGVDEIVPTETSRSIVKIEEKKAESKRARWQAIAESAAKQSKRTIIPKVSAPLKFMDAVSLCSKLDVLIVPYENKRGMIDTLDALKTLKAGMSVGLFIGAEGGFEDKEIEKLKEVGARVVSLGKRILRTETAAITALSMIMLYAECALN